MRPGSFFECCLLFISALLFSCGSQKITCTDIHPGIPMHLADPTLLQAGSTYYVYGTAGDPTPQSGFPVYTSADLRDWKQTQGHQLALKEGDSYGTKGFWAPQVLPWGSLYLMAYTANEQIAVAYGEDPVGPFKQTAGFQPLFNDQFKHIDPFIFQDSGKTYLYYVKLDQGNKIFVSEVRTNITNHLAKSRHSSQTPGNRKFSIVPETERLCIEAAAGWENTAKADWPVTEGPTVIKHKGIYYLFYSANDFRNPDYAVGYATARSPMGPWKKSAQNPIISRKNTGIAGTGHGDVFRNKKGQFYYIFHAHKNDSTVGPRKTLTIPFGFKAVAGQHKEENRQPDKDAVSVPDKIVVKTSAVQSLYISK